MQKGLFEAAAGLASGVLGTLALQRANNFGPYGPQRYGLWSRKQVPGDYLVEAAERLAGRRLERRMHRRAARGAGFLYGLAGPLALGLLGRRLGRGSAGRVLGAGAAMGAIMWAIDHFGSRRSPFERRVRDFGQSYGPIAGRLASHLAFGALSAGPIALIERFARGQEGAEYSRGGYSKGYSTTYSRGGDYSGSVEYRGPEYRGGEYRGPEYSHDPARSPEYSPYPPNPDDRR